LRITGSFSALPAIHFGTGRGESSLIWIKVRFFRDRSVTAAAIETRVAAAG
jgi:hypothetical protein